VDVPARVVITGLGAIAPMSDTPIQLWDNLIAARSAIRVITQYDRSCTKVKVAGEIDFNPSLFLEPREARRMSRDSQLAVVATRQAMRDSGLTTALLESCTDRVGVVMGTTLGGYEIGLREIAPFPKHRIGPYALMNSLPNLPSFYMAREVLANGPSLTVSTACASGTQAIGQGADLIRHNQADIVFAGGVEALIEASLIAGLESMGVMALGFESNPKAACRPFEANRSGLVYSEAVAVLVLESLAHASARGAHIYAELIGYGMSTDRANPAIPDPSGRPARLAMQNALNDARIAADDVNYINPHGPGTSADAIETRAIKQVFGDRAYQIPISSTKSMLGHSMGATGAVEALVTVLTIATGIIHPTINYDVPDPACDLDYVPNTARDATVKVAMSNNLGLGGQNASLIFRAM